MRDVRLIRGDCLAEMPHLPDRSVDMILSDLPYGTTRCAWDTPLPLEEIWEQFRRLARPNAAIVLTATQPFAASLVLSNTAWFRYEWIWEKSRATNPLCARIRPLKAHENILVFYRRLPPYHPRLERGEPYANFGSRKGASLGAVYGEGHVSRHRENHGTRLPRSVIRFASEHGLHPTQKPVALFEYLIRTYTDPGALVLDPCLGSGTTAIACLNAGRRCLGIEADATFFDAARRRVEAAQSPLFVS